MVVSLYQQALHTECLSDPNKPQWTILKMDHVQFYLDKGHVLHYHWILHIICFLLINNQYIWLNLDVRLSVPVQQGCILPRELRWHRSEWTGPILTYLVPPVPLGELSNEKFPACPITGCPQAPLQLTLISSKLSRNVMCHVFLGLPLFLLLSSGTQYIAELSIGWWRMWPAKCLLLTATSSCSCSMPALLVTSSLVTWSCHEITRIVHKQWRRKTSSLWAMFVVLFHVSHA